MKRNFKNPVYETIINRAVFINQDIIVFPSSNIPLPKNLPSVIKFLFGEGAYIEQDVVNDRGFLIIKGASYILSGVKTLNAEWTYTEVNK